VRIREDLRFSIIAEDLDGNISRFAWDFDSDGESERITEKGNTTYAFERLGNYLVSVKIFDDLGIFNSTSIQISVVSSESGFGGIFRFATTACGYAIFMFIVVFLCVIVWYVIIKTNVNKIGSKIRLRKI
jgi:hypothetical protein